MNSTETVPNKGALNKGGRKRNGPEPGPPTMQQVAQAKRDNGRAEMLRQREEAQRAIGLARTGGTTIVEDRSQWLRGSKAGPRAHQAPLIETRAFCVGEAKRFGDERLFALRKACKGDVFFQGYERGTWPESSPFA